MDEIKLKVLIVDDEPQYQEVLQIILESKGYFIKAASSGEEALEILKKEEFDIVLTDLKMGGMDGIELLKNIKERYNNINVILITGYGDIKNAVEAMKNGATSYFVKGSQPEDLISELDKIRKEGRNSIEEFLLKSKNDKFNNLLQIAEKASKVNVNVLITGESGTGKEVMAKYIHQKSMRNSEKFIPINCQAFSQNLLESELFGHEKGSFTGATTNRIGRFEEANKGTLFLDEIGEISLSTQVKLLRVLENRTIERIGSNREIKVDFRLICATNKNLKKGVIEEFFREDLLYRINTIEIHLPPIRERREDLKDLIDFFIKESSKRYKKEINYIEKGVWNYLLNYNYPGNIREMKNIINKLVVLSEQGSILSKFIDEDTESLLKSKNFESEDSTYLKSDNENDFSDIIDIDKIRPLKEVKKEAESKYIKIVLDKFNGNITKSAEYLQISRRQLFNKVVEYEVKGE